MAGSIVPFEATSRCNTAALALALALLLLPFLQLERLIEKNYYLHRSARDGFRSYLLSYASHSLKPVFNVEKLDLQRVAKSFGFSTPPGVSLGILMIVT